MKGDAMSNSLEKQSATRVLIIYDNFYFAAKANAIFQGDTHEGEAATQWDVRPWRLDGLTLSAEADLALADAADARLMVFAGPRAQSLPYWLEDWLEKWVARCRVADAALAVIGGKNGEALTMPARPELSRFASKHGLNFVVNAHIAAGRRAKFVASANFKEESPRLRKHRRPLVAPTYSSHRHWGINE